MILNAKTLPANFDCDKCQTRASGSGCCQSELVRVIESGMHYLVTMPCCIANEAHSGEKSNKCNQCDYAFSEDTFGKTQWGKIKAAVTAS